MSRRRIVLGVILLAVAAVLILYVIPAYKQYRLDQKEEAEQAAFRASWNFNPNDPSLLEVRLLAVDGYTLTIGFPTIVQRGAEKVVDFTPATATFLDEGAQQIHMASKPNATLADIPLGSTIKIRAGADADNPGSYFIYDILVLQ